MLTKTCAVSGKEFIITDEDLAFYEKIGMPPPTLCPDERRRRRLAHRNEWHLYRRKCDATGESIISIYSPKEPWVVYSQEYYWSDKWDMRDYGREYDFSRPFFDQYLELKKVVPRIAISNTKSENSEFTNQSTNNKNCYLVAACSDSEDCMYGMWYFDSQSCLDSYIMEKCELMYESLYCINCYNGQYLENCQNCTDCIMCNDCIGCQSCIGCLGQRNQKYMIFNQSYSKEAWEEQKEKMLSDPPERQRMYREYGEWIKGVPRKYYVGHTLENSTGDYIQNCKNTREAFNARRCEDCAYMADSWEHRDCLDCTETAEGELCYEIHGVGWGNNLQVCSMTWHCHDIRYCDLGFSGGHDCLGCVSLNKNKYCILNKQYTKEEYEELLPRVIEHMKSTGEWGEFFPIGTSSYPYNTTTAQEYFPLTKGEVLEREWRWEDEDKGEYKESSYEPPERIEKVGDEIVNEILACAETGKNYQIKPLELKLLRQMRMPIPRLHPLVRNTKRLARRNPRKLQKRVCDKEGCEVEFETTFTADSPAVVYCEECYNELAG